MDDLNKILNTYLEMNKETISLLESYTNLLKFQAKNVENVVSESDIETMMKVMFIVKTHFYRLYLTNLASSGLSDEVMRFIDKTSLMGVNNESQKNRNN